MPLTVPAIDDRNYQQILNEALARIQVHNPEWTNYNNQSDPGLTLLQLFAFMTESLLYRSNLIPERNRLKFLSLLGVPLQPAASAQGIVAFSNPRGPLRVETLFPDRELLTGQVPFRTQNGLDVLPVEMRVYYKRKLQPSPEVETLYRQLYASYDRQDVALDYYETGLLEAPAGGTTYPVIDLGDKEDAVDGALWLALLARSTDDVAQVRQTIANKTLTLGFLPALSESGRELPPGGGLSAPDQSDLIFEIPRLPETGFLPPDPSQRVARYRPLEILSTDNVLRQPGLVELALPPADALQLWPNLEPLEQGVGDFPPAVEESALQERLITWIRLRPRRRVTGEDVSGQVKARLSWVGLNAARVVQQAVVETEFVGQGNGQPDQSFTLVNTPVISDSLTLTVNGEVWSQTGDLLTAGAETPVRNPRLYPGQAQATASQPSKVYTLDRESGLIRFGDGIHGARPGRGAIIQAGYAYGGGRQGVVGIGAISQGPTLPAGLKVTNPLPTWGGAEAETVAEAERKIPSYLQHRDRLVSREDFQAILDRTPGVDLGRAEVLPLFHPNAPDLITEGVVSIMVIPRFDPVQPAAPQPDRLFLEAVCRHLNPRRLITTELHVVGPVYEKIWLSVGVSVRAGRDQASVREAVKQALRRFLSPLTGGIEETGWPLEKSVEALELRAVAARVAGVAQVNGLRLGQKTGDSKPEIPLAGLQLPRLAGLAVQAGDPLPLETLRGDAAAAAPGDGVTTVPVPVVPDQC